MKVRGSDRSHGRARGVRAVLALVSLALAAGGALAKEPPAGFPSRPVTIVVPYPAGGGVDLIARILAKSMTERWGVAVNVENQAGADGLVGTQRVLRAPADGHTILAQVSQVLLWKSSMPSARIDVLRDFRLVSKIQSTPLMFVAPATLPVDTFGGFVAWCADPSHACTWGSGTAHGQLVGRELFAMAGLTRATHAPYKGTAPMTTDLIGGHIQLAVTSIASAMPHFKAGKLKFLAAAAPARAAALPEVPTLAEAGYRLEAETWYGLMVARATPQPAFDEIVAAVQAASKSPTVLAAIQASGMTPVFNAPAEFAREAQDEAAFLEPLVAKYPLGDR